MKKTYGLIGVIGAGVLLAAAGCDDAPPMSKAQEAAARHPTANPNYKGPSPDAQAKMQQAITAYKQKHANDKVQFNTQ